MTRVRLTAWILLGLLVFPLAARAQTQPSLAEVARQEAERRKAAGRSAKVYTNSDVKGGRPITAAAATPKARTPEKGATEASASQSAPAKPTGAQAVADAKVQRILDLWEQISRNRLEAEKIQGRLDELNTAIVNSFDTVEREALVRDRDAALDNYRKLQADTEGLSRVLADLEAEARKQPAGPR